MTETSEVVELSDLDSNFKYEIAKEPGGESLLNCFQCGTCTAACPVSPIREDFNPRKIIYMSLLGMKEEVLGSEFIWYCSACYSCHERCPQGVHITHLMTVLRNMSFREGKGFEAHRTAVKEIASRGWMIEIGEFDNTMRAKLELPEIKQSEVEANQILEGSGAKKLAGGG